MLRELFDNKKERDNLERYDDKRRQDNRGNGGGNGSGEGDDNRGNSGKGPNRQNLMIMLLATVIALVVISYVMNMGSEGATRISYNEFLQLVNDNKVEEVNVRSDRLEIKLKDTDAIRYTGITEENTALTQRLLDAGVTVNGYIPDSSGMVISFLLSYVLPIIFLWVIMGFIFRRAGSGGLMGSVGKSTAKEYVQKDTGVTFADVAGEDEAKESLQEVVDFLHNPGKYVKIGAKLPKGALLVGPPGTGKTLLAKAVAGEAHVPFFSLTGSDFIELYVGVGASRVRDLFKEANKNAPCIIFIDEIDAIGRSRDSKYGGGNEEREQTLNQLLSEMDGFEPAKGILVLGATNRPEILDKALLRPGRFDRRIIVDRPDLKGRIAILKVHAKDVRMDETVDLEEIALATSGAVGSDLANMINEAAINAVKNNRKYVNQQDLFEAVEQVLVGKEKKDRIMSQKERRIVSYHEVGHALISAVQKNSEPVQKITIVPRTMGALGYVMQVPEEEKYLNTKAELHDMIVGLLGGRAAEELKFETVTTGASNDIERATAIARNMVTQYGMSSKFGLMGLATVESQYLEGRAVLNCSDVTAAAVDEEVRLIMEECYNEAKAILSENMDAMDLIADYLIREETITGKEFMQLYRQAKGIPEPEESEDSAESAIEAERKEIARVEAMPASIPEIKAEAEAGSEEKAEAAPEAAAPEIVVPEPTKAQDAPEIEAPETAKAEAAPEADDEEEEAEEKPAKNGPRGRFTDVPQEDVDRFFKK
ncbi:MAG: ATP-dependent zinc metalloprotease FtsH [Lachnospiraceae bacterium]|nr:ATP-dependent zinc metalloprotease FtsH [Lachnospiraceae bacterium]